MKIEGQSEENPSCFQWFSIDKTTQAYQRAQFYHRTIFFCLEYMMEITPNMNGVHEIRVHGMDGRIK